MATRITFRASSNLSQADSPVLVKESVAEVASLVNTAQENKHRFVALTDAETDKEISIKAARVSDIKEE